MFCVKCGAKNNDNARFCEKCGNKINSESSSRKNISTPYYQDYVLSSWKTNPVRKLSNRLKVEGIIDLLIVIILLYQICIAIFKLIELVSWGLSKGFDGNIKVYEFITEGSFNQYKFTISDTLKDSTNYYSSVFGSGRIYAGDIVISSALIVTFLLTLISIAFFIVKFIDYRKKNYKYAKDILSNPVYILKKFIVKKHRIRYIFIIFILWVITVGLGSALVQSELISYYTQRISITFLIAFYLSLFNFIFSKKNTKYVTNNAKVFYEIEQNYLKTKK